LVVFAKTEVNSLFDFRHYVVYNEISLGPTIVSGVVHDGAYIANAIVPEGGIGPCRTIVGNYDSTCTEKPVHAKGSLILDAASIDENDNERRTCLSGKFHLLFISSAWHEGLISPCAGI